MTYFKTINKDYIFYILYDILVFVFGTLMDFKVTYIIALIAFPVFLQIFLYDFEKFTYSILILSNLYYQVLFSSSDVVVRLFFISIPLLIYQIIIYKFRKISSNQRETAIEFQKIPFILLGLFFFNIVIARMKLPTIVWLSYFMQGFLWFYFLKGYFSQKKRIMSTFIYLNLTALPFYLVGFKELLQMERVSSFTEGPNTFVGYAVFFVIMNLFLVRNCKHFIIKITSVIIIFMSLIIIIGTQSRGGQIGFIIALFLYLFLYNLKNIKKMFYYLVFFMCSIAIFAISFGSSYLQRYMIVSNSSIDVSTLDRLGMWWAAIKLFAESPIYGIGLNNYYFYYSKYHMFFKLLSLKQLKVAHNLYLNVLAESGIIGFLVLVFILVYIGKYLVYLLFKSDIDHVGKDIVVCCACYYVYFLIHNLLDCIWIAINHQIVLFHGAIVLALIFVVERLYKKSEDKEISDLINDKESG